MFDDVSYLDNGFPGRGVVKAFEEMTVEEFALWREDYYLGLMAFSPFGKNEHGEDLAPHGSSVHGVAKLRPEDQ
jgi:hypothetical protein